MQNIKESKMFLILVVIVLIIISYFIFLLIINTVSNKKNVNKDLLTCEITNQDLYDVVFKTKFKDDKVYKVTIQYIKNIEITSTDIDLGNASEKQMDYFCTLKGSTFTYINNDLIITLNDKVYETNKNDKIIKNIFNTYDNVKTYYEKLGYTCK